MTATPTTRVLMCLLLVLSLCASMLAIAVPLRTRTPDRLRALADPYSAALLTRAGARRNTPGTALPRHPTLHCSHLHGGDLRSRTHGRGRGTPPLALPLDRRAAFRTLSSRTDLLTPAALTTKPITGD